MTEFYLPYQFIPATGKIKETPTATIDFQEIQQGSGNHINARHDVWLKNKLHGRIACSIYLETPLVVGAAHEPIGKAPAHGQKDERQKKVIPYKYKDQYAIPANSLRGMVSNIAEALSQSALRVLEDKPLNASKSDRTKVPLGTTYDYFPADILPLAEQRRANGSKNTSGQPLLTPAEILFGVVEEGKDTDNSAIALKSRLKFHDALPKDGVSIALEEEITLKILDTPKPPAPAMYFLDSRNPRYFIEKTKLDRNIHQPRGRKVYLHHQQPDIAAQKWITAGVNDRNDRANQKMKCTPIAAGQSFCFHIDFENLTSAELKVLETSLTPHPDFRHRLGLGKPIGLGSIHVKIEKIDFRCPVARYSLSALNPPRDDDSVQPARYDNTDTSLIDAETLQILISIGKRSAKGETNLRTGVPVRYPFINSPDEEEELFKWYAKNEKQGEKGTGQVLGLVKPEQPLPTLFTPDQIPPSHPAGNPPPHDNAQPKHIREPREIITDENRWIRYAVVTICQRQSFDDAGLTQGSIIKCLYGKALAEAWHKLPDVEHQEVQFKSNIRQYILDSIAKHGCDHHLTTSSGGIRAKRIYDAWPNQA
jgi:hypothetical protein